MSGFACVEMPELPLVGGCQCGRLRYRVTATPLTYYICHCTLCQKQSGSAFGSSMQVAGDAVEVDGERKFFRHAGGSGRMMDWGFCPDCGVRVTHQIEGRDVVVIKPGTLDDTSWLKPAGHIFTATRQPWVELTEADGLLFEDAPNLEALRTRWREMIGAASA